MRVANLDPAAEQFKYSVAFGGCATCSKLKGNAHKHIQPPADIRDLISVEDVMSELQLGPNGGLMYCME
jgi:hypothetical protein